MHVMICTSVWYLVLVVTPNNLVISMTCTVNSSGAALLHHFLCIEKGQYFGNKYKGDLRAPLIFVCRDHACRDFASTIVLSNLSTRGGLSNI